jgi:hypothetical protein
MYDVTSPYSDAELDGTLKNDTKHTFLSFHVQFLSGKTPK